MRSARGILAGAIALCLALTAPTADAREAVVGDRQASKAAVCPRLLPFVEFAFGMWGGPGTSLRREPFAALGSRGADRPSGYVIFGSVTPTRTYLDRACLLSPLPTAGTAALSKPHTYRRAGENAYFEAADGERLIGSRLHQRSVSPLHLREANGITFSCPTQTRVQIRVRESKSGSRVPGAALRVVHGREVLGLAVVRRDGQSTLRVSKRCEEG